MNNFKIPTDNLYKFLAISGLIIIFSNYFFLLFGYYKLGLKQLDTDLKISILDKESQQLLDELSFLEREVSDLERDVNEGKLSKEILIEEAKEFRTKAQQIDDIKKKQEIKLVEVKNAHKVDGYLIKELKFFSYISLVLVIIGSIITSLGFFGWYTKLQRYQDLIIKKKSED